MFGIIFPLESILLSNIGFITVHGLNEGHIATLPPQHVANSYALLHNILFLSWPNIMMWYPRCMLYLLSPCGASFYGSRRIIHTSKSKLWRISKAKSSIKSCIGHKYKCDYKVWCQTVDLKSWYLYFLPYTPEITFGLENEGNATESQILIHSSLLENSWPMTRPPHNHRIIIIYQILH